jgi:glycosyltransferase involved in cell wall biosynthesis
MHVVYLYTHFNYPGGATIVVLETAKRLVKKGVKVSIISQSGNAEILKEYPGIHFEFVGGPLPKSLSYWIQYFRIYKRVEKILDDTNPDIIFPQIFPANYWGFLYKNHNPKIPCIWYVHDVNVMINDSRWIAGLPVAIRFFAKISNPIMKFFDKKMVSRADYILTNSDFTAELCKRIYGISQTETIYPGLDIDEFPKTPEKKECYFLCVSRLEYFKRIDLVLRSVFLLKKAGKTIKLIIIGDGPETKKLIQQSEAYGLSAHVFFMGTIDRELLISYYAKALCVVFPSIDEPFGIVPIEAQAAWTPVIATNCGGPVETILDGETGFLIKPDSTDEMTDRILYFLQNPSMAASMGVSARKHVSEKFTWEKTSDKLLEVFTRFAH